MSDFRKLDVWRKGHELALRVHRIAGGIHGATNLSLRSQMVRAAMSIPANIVEGSSQDSRRDFGRYLSYAANSATELEYHLMLARDIRAIGLSDFTGLVSRTVEIRKMLRGLLKRVSASYSEDKAPKPTARRAR